MLVSQAPAAPQAEQAVARLALGHLEPPARDLGARSVRPAPAAACRQCRSWTTPVPASQHPDPTPDPASLPTPAMGTPSGPVSSWSVDQVVVWLTGELSLPAAVGDAFKENAVAGDGKRAHEQHRSLSLPPLHGCLLSAVGRACKGGQGRGRRRWVCCNSALCVQSFCSQAAWRLGGSRRRRTGTGLAQAQAD